MMRMVPIILEISTPIDVTLAWLLVLRAVLKPRKPCRPGSPHVSPAVSLPSAGPRVVRTVHIAREQLHLRQGLCLPAVDLLRVKDPNFPSGRVGTRSGA